MNVRLSYKGLKMDDIEVLDCFIRMPSPQKSEILKREKKVRDAIEKMGDKYRLSTLVQKKGGEK